MLADWSLSVFSEVLCISFVLLLFVLFIFSNIFFGHILFVLSNFVVVVGEAVVVTLVTLCLGGFTWSVCIPLITCTGRLNLGLGDAVLFVGA